MASGVKLVQESVTGVRIAVEGCGHGALHAIYKSVTAALREKQWPSLDLLIIGGDFQAVRNSLDLNTMSVPTKYREIGDFHEYYSGKRMAPYLTIFAGGNHEASNHLFELYYGGWVAPNIYYLGAANVLRLGPLRIAGLSGIWKGFDYRKAHHERLPYSADDVKSIYHVREWDVRKLLLLRTQVDVGLSHDWPQGVEWCGESKALFKMKNAFEADARTGRLGSVAAREVMERIRPRFWFSGHMHVKFSAIVEYTDQQKAKIGEPGQDMEVQLSGQAGNAGGQAPAGNAEEIEIDLDDLEDQPTTTQAEPKPESIKPDTTTSAVSEELKAQLPEAFRSSAPNVTEKLPFPEAITNRTTNFLALDKCLPGRKFLQLVEILPPHDTAPEEHTRPLKLEFDKEWLAITKVFGDNLVVGDPKARPPRDEGEAAYRKQIETQEQWVEENLVAKGRMLVPENFQLTAPVYNPSIGISMREQPVEYTNPQTSAFCSMLQMANPFDISAEERQERVARGPAPSSDRGSYRGRRGGGGNRGGGFGGGRGGRGRGGRRY